MSTTPAANLRLSVDLAGCDSKPELLQRMAIALQFPAWFGHNWDALADCLCDLSWLPARRYTLELVHSQDLRHADPDTLHILVEILAEAAAFWDAQGTGFDIVDLDDREQAADA